MGYQHWSIGIIVAGALTACGRGVERSTSTLIPPVAATNVHYQSEPAVYQRELEKLAPHIIEAAVRLFSSFDDGSYWGKLNIGSGSLISNDTQRAVVITAAHIVNHDNIPLRGIEFVQDHLMRPPGSHSIFGASLTYTQVISDSERDLAIIVMDLALLPQPLARDTIIDPNWVPIPGESLFGLSFPSHAQGDAVPVFFKVADWQTPQGTAMTELGEFVLDSDDSEPDYGMSGTVLFDKKGSAVAVLKKKFGLGLAVRIGSFVSVSIQQVK